VETSLFNEGLGRWMSTKKALFEARGNRFDAFWGKKERKKSNKQEKKKENCLARFAGCWEALVR
jgi:hypothetical protein